jgi:alternate signal-mediated exported protein
MRKSTKGALAGSAAALLLMGGMGTHATWNDDDVVSGTDVNTGHLKIQDWTCGVWKLGVTTFAPATDLIVPGDVLTRVCTFKIDIAGSSASATLDIDTPSFVDTNGDPVTVLSATAAFAEDLTNDPITTLTPATSGVSIRATLTAQLSNTVTGLTGQDLAAQLNDVTVTATQD